jgi:GntR family transcriptional regulator
VANRRGGERRIEAAPERLIPGSALGVPLYREVKRVLLEALIAGEWRPGAALPAERILAERFRVAIGTLRKAVDELVQENVLVRQQGRGTFVATHNRERYKFQFFHIVDAEGRQEYPEVQLLDFGKGRAEEHEAAALRLARGDGVFRIHNLLSLHGVPVELDRISIAQARFPGLTERQFRDRPGTVYQLYQTAFGVTVVRSAERLRAVAADPEDAKLLGVGAGEPLLQIRRVALTYEDEPVEFRMSVVNTADHEYRSDVR